ncbi:Pimeloyl-ACP methyl ester carboxylesterase [Jiangella alba]|uniref:Pimeloyl-ACP methyl ester carboxylesterase n=1 Tax=Jiangella alba TaxID=561176 RepID=A0A1H5PY80_9ACTN|nr:Pimeloyl-ACP methyl ester carboxylesterase [Jiangella alba]
MDGARIAFRVSGSGPPLLAPECNYTWDPGFERLMARRFTLIVASPRDYGRSSRAAGPAQPDLWATDLLAVARHLGHPRFLCFGYSFTGACGPWLALRLAEHASVAAVASGGFPLLGDYGITSRDVDGQLARLENDPGTWAAMESRFDPRAGAAFYRRLSLLPPDALVDDAPCPLYCFWGDRDHDAVGMVLPGSELAAGLSARGVPWRQYEGYDHEELNGRLEVAWPDTEAWLLDRAADHGLG